MLHKPWEVQWMKKNCYEWKRKKRTHGKYHTSKNTDLKVCGSDIDLVLLIPTSLSVHAVGHWWVLSHFLNPHFLLSPLGGGTNHVCVCVCARVCMCAHAQKYTNDTGCPAIKNNSLHENPLSMWCASWPFEMRTKTDPAPWIACYFLNMRQVRKFRHLVNLKCIVTL